MNPFRQYNRYIDNSVEWNCLEANYFTLKKKRFPKIRPCSLWNAREALKITGRHRVSKTAKNYPIFGLINAHADDHIVSMSE